MTWLRVLIIIRLNVKCIGDGKYLLMVKKIFFPHKDKIH